ncbi:transcriptional regulator TbsP [Haladaptatus salinisoli]|uniref:transcriptional regulator TbsP n=1 Tax=Haladaptatus salinisoli TaxID=2884876 RepID=UPI001D0BB85F|nr:DUF5821 family protein [Haladaptatus salinisoli]
MLVLIEKSMSSTAAVLDQEFKEIIQSVLEETESLLLINPAPKVFREFVLTVSEVDDHLPDIQVLASPDVLKTVTDDFIVASQISDLIEQETLALRATTEISRNSLLVSDDQVVAFLAIDGKLSGLSSEDDEFVDNVRSTFNDEWETSNDFNLRTPPLSRVKKTLREEFGDEVEDDFMTVLDSVESVPGEENELDEVTIALLVGAKNNELLYDISKWGEDTGVASKATFSRTKTRLEDRNVIETEKVPIEIGRPRLRLLLVEDNLQNSEDLIEQVDA